MIYRITEEAIDSNALLAEITVETAGAIVTFHGIARRFSHGRDILYLEYAAYDSMALTVLQQIGAEIYAQFEIERIAIVHRTGRVNIGETSIVIAVAAAHRQAALNGCSYAIERIKQILPVWKKEVWQDGAEWLQGV